MLLRNANSITHRPVKAGIPYKHQILKLVILSATLNLLLEILSRRSLIEGISFITENSYTFFYNMLIILMTLSVALLFTRMNFIVILLSSVWLGLGIANFVILGFRTTPLAAIDFILLKSVVGIIPFYLSTYQLILITFICAASLAFLALAWRKSPKHPVVLSRTVIALSLIIVLLFTLPGISATNLGNLVNAYNEYGFAYCFATSVIDRGIKEPEGYSQENIHQILASIQSDDTNTPNLTPNIIMLQLECFFDVDYLLDLELSENPLPNFTKLKSDFSSGFLTVPSIGAGTANTEFEVISGMNLEYFGLGEYPYKTILKSSTTETLGYNLSEVGYHNHAIHNNTGFFYDRNNVFANLGFNGFSSIEYMHDVEYNSVGWAKDNILITEILKALEATTTQDFIYAISVQAHGKYPELAVDGNKIKVIGNPDEREANALEYFVNQIYEVDLFLGNLISVLSSHEEPVVLVVFGDHLPSLSIEDEDLKNGDRYQTEYVIWSNFPMAQINRDLKAYQLSAYVMERLGMNNGLLTKLHQSYSDKDSYQDKLVMLQYDMLYGDMYAYGGTNPHLTTELKMGTSKIEITEVSQKHGSIFVDGEGFTPWSKVCIDEKPVNTLYIDQNTVIVADKRLKNGSRVFVAQISDNGRMLSQTEEWIYQKEVPLGANGHITKPPTK